MRRLVTSSPFHLHGIACCIAIFVLTIIAGQSLEQRKDIPAGPIVDVGIEHTQPLSLKLDMSTLNGVGIKEQVEGVVSGIQGGVEEIKTRVENVQKGVEKLQEGKELLQKGLGGSSDEKIEN